MGTLFTVTGAIGAALGLMACGNSGGSASTSCNTFYTTLTTNTKMAPRELTNDWTKIAQSFQITGTEPLQTETISLYLQKRGSVDEEATLTLTVVADTSNAPDESNVVGTATREVSTLPDTAGLVTFTFSTALTLQISTTYWLVLSADYAASNSNLVDWMGHDGSSSGYSDGKAAYKDQDITWGDTKIGAFRDLAFGIDCG